MENIRCFGIASAAVLLLAAFSRAEIVLQDEGNIDLQVNALEPIGQSFTAEDPSVDFAFYVVAMNTFLPSETLTVSLHEGSGFAGAVLASDTINPAGTFQGYFDADLTGAALTVGNVYTAEISSSNAYWGIEGLSTGEPDLPPGGDNPYAGGTGFLDGVPGGPPDSLTVGDFRFRITPTPEPACGVLLSLGFAWIAARRHIVSKTKAHSRS